MSEKVNNDKWRKVDESELRMDGERHRLDSHGSNLFRTVDMREERRTLSDGMSELLMPLVKHLDKYGSKWLHDAMCDPASFGSWLLRTMFPNTLDRYYWSPAHDGQQVVISWGGGETDDEGFFTRNMNWTMLMRPIMMAALVGKLFGYVLAPEEQRPELLKELECDVKELWNGKIELNENAYVSPFGDEDRAHYEKVAPMVDEPENAGIPANLDECFAWLKDRPDDRGLMVFKRMGESKAVAASHLGMGRWIRINWGLWTEDGPLHKFMTDLGLHHADDMSGLIIRSLHRHLNGKPLRVYDQVGHYKEYWAKVEKYGGGAGGPE